MYSHSLVNGRNLMNRSDRFVDVYFPGDSPPLDRYGRHFVGAVILTHNGQLLFQKRGSHFDRFPGTIATFGGLVEPGETIQAGLVRELAEELGAKVLLDEVVYLGAFTKKSLSDALIHGFFWQDLSQTVDGCYEGEPCYFSCAAAVLADPSITLDVHWLVEQSLERRLIR